MAIRKPGILYSIRFDTTHLTIVILQTAYRIEFKLLITREGGNVSVVGLFRTAVVQNYPPRRNNSVISFSLRALWPIIYCVRIRRTYLGPY